MLTTYGHEHVISTQMVSNHVHEHATSTEIVKLQICSVGPSLSL